VADTGITTRPARNELLRVCPDFAGRVQDTGCCIVWIGPRDNKGYGRAYPRDERTTLTHRIAYQRANGAVGSLAVDHLCYVKACVNLQHLEAVPAGVNVRRAAERRRTAVQAGEGAGRACCEEESQRLAVPRRVRPASPWRAVEQRRRERDAREVALGIPDDAWLQDAPDLVVVPLPAEPGRRPKYRVIDRTRATASERELLAEIDCQGS
jgi:hypothetical protein